MVRTKVIFPEPRIPFLNFRPLSSVLSDNLFYDYESEIDHNEYETLEKSSDVVLPCVTTESYAFEVDSDSESLPHGNFHVSNSNDRHLFAFSCVGRAIILPNIFWPVIVSYLELPDIVSLSSTNKSLSTLSKLQNWIRICAWNGGAADHRRAYWLNYCFQLPSLQLYISSYLETSFNFNPNEPYAFLPSTSCLLSEPSSPGASNAHNLHWRPVSYTLPSPHSLASRIFHFLLCQDVPSSVLDEIRVDVSRTFPDVPLFSQKRGCSGQRMLGLVLRGIAALCPDIGYCQGLNFVAGALMLHLSNPRFKNLFDEHNNNDDSSSTDEVMSNGKRMKARFISYEEAVEDCLMDDESLDAAHAAASVDLVGTFWAVVSLLFNYDFNLLFGEQIPLLQMRLSCMNSLVQDRLPKLHTHLRDIGVGVDVLSQQWLMTAFSYSLTLRDLGLVWDRLFTDGWGSLFETGLAILTSMEQEALKFQDLEGLMMFVQQMQGANRHVENYNYSAIAENHFIEKENENEEKEEDNVLYKCSFFSSIQLEIAVNAGFLTRRGICSSPEIASCQELQKKRKIRILNSISYQNTKFIKMLNSINKPSSNYFSSSGSSISNSLLDEFSKDFRVREIALELREIPCPPKQVKLLGGEDEKELSDLRKKSFDKYVNSLSNSENSTQKNLKKNETSNNATVSSLPSSTSNTSLNKYSHHSRISSHASLSNSNTTRFFNTTVEEQRRIRVARGGKLLSASCLRGAVDIDSRCIFIDMQPLVGRWGAGDGTVLNDAMNRRACGCLNDVEVKLLSAAQSESIIKNRNWKREMWRDNVLSRILSHEKKIEKEKEKQLDHLSESSLTSPVRFVWEDAHSESQVSNHKQSLASVSSCNNHDVKSSPRIINISSKSQSSSNMRKQNEDDDGDDDDESQQQIGAFIPNKSPTGHKSVATVDWLRRPASMMSNSSSVSPNLSCNSPDRLNVANHEVLNSGQNNPSSRSAVFNSTALEGRQPRTPYRSAASEASTTGVILKDALRSSSLTEDEDINESIYSTELNMCAEAVDNCQVKKIKNENSDLVEFFKFSDGCPCDYCYNDWREFKKNERRIHNLDSLVDESSVTDHILTNEDASEVLENNSSLNVQSQIISTRERCNFTPVEFEFAKLISEIDISMFTPNFESFATRCGGTQHGRFLKIPISRLWRCLRVCHRSVSNVGEDARRVVKDLGPLGRQRLNKHENVMAAKKLLDEIYLEIEKLEVDKIGLIQHIDSVVRRTPCSSPAISNAAPLSSVDIDGRMVNLGVPPLLFSSLPPGSNNNLIKSNSALPANPKFIAPSGNLLLSNPMSSNNNNNNMNQSASIIQQTSSSRNPLVSSASFPLQSSHNHSSHSINNNNNNLNSASVATPLSILKSFRLPSNAFASPKIGGGDAINNNAAPPTSVVNFTNNNFNVSGSTPLSKSEMDKRDQLHQKLLKTDEALSAAQAKAIEQKVLLAVATEELAKITARVTLLTEGVSKSTSNASLIESRGIAALLNIDRNHPGGSKATKNTNNYINGEGQNNLNNFTGKKFNYRSLKSLGGYLTHQLPSELPLFRSRNTLKLDTPYYDACKYRYQKHHHGEGDGAERFNIEDEIKRSGFIRVSSAMKMPPLLPSIVQLLMPTSVEMSYNLGIFDDSADEDISMN